MGHQTPPFTPILLSTLSPLERAGVTRNTAVAIAILKSWNPPGLSGRDHRRWHVLKPPLRGVGFILYDCGYSGNATYYEHEWVDHRWDWGPEDSDYAFVVEPDGTGLFYDFSNVGYGESRSADVVY